MNGFRMSEECCNLHRGNERHVQLTLYGVACAGILRWHRYFLQILEVLKRGAAPSITVFSSLENLWLLSEGSIMPYLLRSQDLLRLGGRGFQAHTPPPPPVCHREVAPLIVSVAFVFPMTCRVNPRRAVDYQKLRNSLESWPDK